MFPKLVHVLHAGSKGQADLRSLDDTDLDTIFDPNVRHLRGRTCTRFAMEEIIQGFCPTYFVSAVASHVPLETSTLWNRES